MRAQNRLLPLIAALIAVGLGASTAQAAALVLGGGDGEACYRAALHGASDRQSLLHCARALDDEPLTPKDRASTHINRGGILVNRKAYAEAMADFDAALKLNPGSGEAYLNRGAARLGLKQWHEALADLDHSLEAGSSQPEKAWFNKGIAHEALGDLKAAYEDYGKAQALKPGWDLPKQELARFHVETR